MISIFGARNVHDYLFVVTSTINTPHGVFDSAARLKQTVDGLRSIKHKVPNSKIIFVDNSLDPLTANQLAEITPLIDYCPQHSHHLFSRFINQTNYNKGLGELLLMEQIMPIIKKDLRPNHRVFKISGRYKLSDSFDIQRYRDPKFDNKYSFVQTVWAFTNDNYKTASHLTFNETRLWSFDAKLIEEVDLLLQKIFNYMLQNNHNIEVSLNHCLDPLQVVVMDRVHVEGHFFSGEFRQE